MTIGQLFQILKARRWVVLGVTAFLVVLALALSLLLPPQYTAEAVLAIDVGSSDPLTGQPDSSMGAPGYLMTQTQIIQSHNTALRVIKAMKLDQVREIQDSFMAATQGRGNIADWLADQITRNLTAKIERDANIINIRYTSHDPKFSSDMANAFAAAYVGMVTDIHSSAQQQNNAFFQGQLKTLQANLANAQNRLSEFQQQHGIVATDEKVDVETQRLNDLSAQMVVAQSQALDAQSRARHGSVQPDVINNPLVQNLKGQVAQLEAKFKELSAKEGTNNPAYQQAKAELDESRAQLNQAMATYSTGLSSSASNASAHYSEQKRELDLQRDKVLALKTLRSQSQILEREVESDQNAFDAALRRQTETSLEAHSSSRGGTSMLKSAPEPLDPSFPKLPLNLALGVVLGLLFGAVIAVLAELSNRRVRSVADVELLLNLPTLAMIQSKRGRISLLRSARPSIALNSGVKS